MHTDERLTAFAMQQWDSHLSGFTDQDINRALTAMVLKHPEWPPTLGEFMALATPPLTTRDFTHVNRREVNPEGYAAIQASLRQIRDSLRGK